MSLKHSFLDAKQPNSDHNIYLCNIYIHISITFRSHSGNILDNIFVGILILNIGMVIVFRVRFEML